MQIALSLLIAVLGLLIYVLSGKPKVETLGLIAFGAGLLAFLLHVPQHFSVLGM